jgi:2-polyprenyl-3-methyl-5-hydroxy-6-metoxy-1,4-benzoquinol methylase
MKKEGSSFDEIKARNAIKSKGNKPYPNKNTENMNEVRHPKFLDEKVKVTKTDWGSVADKYDKYLNSESSYHNEVILPNFLRLLGDVSGKNILEIACGQGYFCEEINKKATENKSKVNVSGFDLGADLIKIAMQNAGKNKSNINYKVLNAENFADEYSKNDNKFDVIFCILALQNIENIKLVIENTKNVLNEKGKVVFVINHPSYRIPKSTSWGNVTELGAKEIQYRRVDKYMSEDKIKMDMTPAEKREAFKKYTYSYHRPLQTYFKIFANQGFVVTKLEEWISNKTSEGKNADRENTARKEFPMFMCLEIKLA